MNPHGGIRFDMTKHRKVNHYGAREDAKTVAEIYEFLENGYKVVTIMKMTGLSFRSIEKYRERWKEAKKMGAAPVKRAVPKIELSDTFITSRIELLRKPPYVNDPELSMLAGVLVHYLEVRGHAEKRVDPVGQLS